MTTINELSTASELCQAVYLAAALKAASPTAFADTFTFNAPGFAEPLGASPAVLKFGYARAASCCS